MLSRLIVAALALALAATTEAAPRSCTQLPPQNAIFAGEPIDLHVAGLTLDECNNHCTRNSECVGYDWMPERGPNRPKSICLLNSLISIGTQLKYDAHDYNGTISARCGPNLPTMNGDFPGNDLSNAPAADAVQCSYTCEKTDGCVAYSWTNYNGGTCWMKKTTPSSTSAPFDGSVTSGTVFKCLAQTNDNDIAGGDLKSVPRTDWRDCCTVCMGTPGCKASSWTNYNGGTCWLKKDYSRMKDRYVEGARSVVLTSVWNTGV